MDLFVTQGSNKNMKYRSR